MDEVELAQRSTYHEDACWSKHATKLKASPCMQVRFWDGERLEQVKTHDVPWIVESASYCPEKGRFVAGGEDMWVHLYDYESGAELECNKGAPLPSALRIILVAARTTLLRPASRACIMLSKTLL